MQMKNDASTWEQKQVVAGKDCKYGNWFCHLYETKIFQFGKHLHGTAKDIYGQEVKPEQLFTVIDPESGNLYL